MSKIKRLIECTGDGYDMGAIVGVYDVATMKPEDLAKQRARHNREFVSASDYDALVRRVEEMEGIVAAYLHISERGKECWDYCRQYAEGRLGRNIWHVVLEDAKRYRELTKQAGVNL